MIAKISRGWAVGGLVRYLMGPGKANEHVDQRVIATWDGVPRLHQPARDGSACGFDVRELIEDLVDPALAGRVPLTPSVGVNGKRRLGPVWHCSLRNADGDRLLSDAEWSEVVEDLLDRTGIARRGDAGGCRWVAVRHADDHIHIAAMLIRQDTRRRVHPWRDGLTARDVCRDAERRLGLTRTAPADRTAACAPTTAEREKARRLTGGDHRQGQVPETSRERLRRTVRVAAVQAHDPESFFRRLQELGVLVRPREGAPGELVGYAVAAGGDVDADGQPVWFGGRRLAPDLSLPALRARWQSAATPGDTTAPPHVRLSVGWDEPASAIAAATRAAEQARAALRNGDAAVGPWIAHATADLLTALCTLTGGSPPPPVWVAADEFDRAARTPDLRHLARHPDRCAPAARELRRAAWRLAALRLPGSHGDGGPAELLAAVAVLVAEIAAYHRERQHHAQAAAARRTCAVLPRPRPRVEPDRAGGARDATAHPASRASAVFRRPTGTGTPRSGAGPGGSPTRGRPSPPPPMDRRPRPPDIGRGRGR